ncbi:MAG: asparaginase [Desulfovibrionaceae bacterium]
MTQQARPGEIAVFFTGGTIGMSEDAARGGVVPGDNFQNILDQLRHTHPGLRLRPVNWSDKPSGHMTPEDMLRLSQDVDAALARPETLGAVVLHGTDVIVESAFLLDITLASPKPVVFTGSMRYYRETGYDGLRNLLGSLLAVLKPLPADMGVVLCMTDRLFAARDVVKVNSMNVDAFESYEAGIVGFIAGNDVVLTHPSGFARRTPLRVPRIEPNVPLLACHTGMDGGLLDHALASGARAVVLEGFGAGNVPPGLLPALERALAAGMVVVVCTRCAQGGVWPVYAYPGGAADLRSRGALLGGRLESSKVRLLLMAALGAGMGREEIASLLS